MKYKCAALLLSLFSLSSCGHLNTTIPFSFAITLESDDLLEISVFKNESAMCSDITALSVDSLTPREARQQLVAKDLNDGEIETLIKDLPAEQNLSFYARIKRPGSGTIAEDCKDDVIIKENTVTRIELSFK